MEKYICSICGYVYDEEKGIPDENIPSNTNWNDIPEGWTCPICGASKSEFNLKGVSDKPVEKKPVTTIKASSDMNELSPLEISAICSNLAKGCKKQYKAEEAELFTELAEYFKKATATVENADFDILIDLVQKDLNEVLPNAKEASTTVKDRGAARALTWSEKVTRILNSLLTRYKKEGDAMLENTGVYVCTICGFIYIGDTLPEVCPVCKVPNWKFEKVEGRK